jgi:hypothetical protein
MKQLKIIATILAMGLLSSMADAQTKPDTNKYYLTFNRPQLDNLTKQVMKIDSTLANSNLPAKDAITIITFLNGLQDAFLQNFKIQVAEMEKKGKVKK